MVAAILLAVGAWVLFTIWQSGKAKRAEALSVYTEPLDESADAIVNFRSMTCTMFQFDAGIPNTTMQIRRNGGGAWEWRLAPTEAAAEQAEIDKQLTSPTNMFGAPIELTPEQSEVLRSRYRELEAGAWVPIAHLHVGAIENQYQMFLAATK